MWPVGLGRGQRLLVWTDWGHPSASTAEHSGSWNEDEGVARGPDPPSRGPARGSGSQRCGRCGSAGGTRRPDGFGPRRMRSSAEDDRRGGLRVRRDHRLAGRGQRLGGLVRVRRRPPGTRSRPERPQRPVRCTRPTPGPVRGGDRRERPRNPHLVPGPSAGGSLHPAGECLLRRDRPPQQPSDPGP
jgi:hypothetical protein